MVASKKLKSHKFNWLAPLILQYYLVDPFLYKTSSLCHSLYLSWHILNPGLPYSKQCCTFVREFPWLSSVIRKESGFLCNGVLEFILKPIRGCTVTYYITHPSQSSQKNVTRPLLLHQFSSMPAFTQSQPRQGPTRNRTAMYICSAFPKVFNLTVLLQQWVF